MRTLQEIFDKNYSRMIERGKSKEHATEHAFESCYDALYVGNAIEEWTDKDIEALWLAHKAKEQAWDKEQAMKAATEERDNWAKNAMIGYHEIGKPFKANFNGTVRTMIAEERKGFSCYGCAFCGITGYIDVRPIWGCKIVRKGAVCHKTFTAKNGIELPLRTDGKDVIFKYVKSC